MPTTTALFVVGQSGPSVTIRTTPGVPVTTRLSISPALPAGLRFVDNGNGTATISGTPGAGTASLTPYGFMISATNAPGSTATENFQITISEASTFTNLAAATFVEGQAGTFTVQSTGVPPPILGCSTLPNGLTFTDNRDGTGTIAGTPVAGTGRLQPYGITISASTSGNTPSAQNVSITITRPPVFI